VGAVSNQEAAEKYPLDDTVPGLVGKLEETKQYKGLKMSIMAPRLVYPTTQKSAWHRLQIELGKKKLQHLYVAVQEPQKSGMELVQQESPARSTPGTVPKFGATKKHEQSCGPTPERT
jgi:hypothetical protein